VEGEFGEFDVAAGFECSEMVSEGGYRSGRWDGAEEGNEEGD